MMKLKTLSILFIFALAVFVEVNCGTKHPLIQEDSWRNHPEIVEIREIVQKIHSSVNPYEHIWTECEGNTEFYFLIDKKNVIRYYSLRQSGEDFGEIAEAFFDEKGELRFYYRLDSSYAPDHTDVWKQLELRIYYDSSGNKIWVMENEKETPEEKKFNQMPVFFSEKMNHKNIPLLLKDYGCDDLSD